MKWLKYKLSTTTEALDAVSEMLAEFGIDGIEVEDKVPLTEEDKKQMFVYILHNNLMINNAYRHGIYRVGCMVCPMSAKWQDSLIAHNYHDEMATSLSLIEDLTMYAKGKLDKKYVEDGGWQVRAGGKILKQGENRIAETIEDGKLIIDIKNARQ